MPKLQFKFDPNQDFQLQAIDSVVKVFDGLSRFTYAEPWDARGTPPTCQKGAAMLQFAASRKRSLPIRESASRLDGGREPSRAQGFERNLARWPRLCSLARRLVGVLSQS